MIETVGRFGPYRPRSSPADPKIDMVESDEFVDFAVAEAPKPHYLSAHVRRGVRSL